MARVFKVRFIFKRVMMVSSMMAYFINEMYYYQAGLRHRTRRFAKRICLLFTFCLDASFGYAQEKQKVKAGRNTSPSCRTAMFGLSATVASAFYFQNDFSFYFLLS